MENKMSTGKKIGYFFLSATPAVGMILCMVFSMVPLIFAKMFSLVLQYGPTDEYMNAAMNLTSDSQFLVTASIIGEGAALVAGYLFYYFLFKQKKMDNPFKVFNLKGFLGIILMFVGVEALCGVYLNILGFIAPDMIEKYGEMIEKSGLGDLTLLSTIASVIVAPIAEEVFFRGMTLKICGKFTKKFWIANIIQALFFGIVHGNFVQGSYAFAMGLVLGYIYKRFNSLYASILAHLVFNITGTWLVAVIFGSAEAETPVWRLCVVAAFAAVLIIGASMMIKKNSRCDEHEKNYMARIHGVFGEETVGNEANY